MMEINLKSCMFSRADSYLAVGWLDNLRYPQETQALGEGVYIRQLYGSGRRSCLRLSLPDCLSPVLHATPGELCMDAVDGTLGVTFMDAQRLMGRAQQARVQLEMETSQYEYAATLDARRFLLNSSACRLQFLITVLEGEAQLNAPYGDEGCLSISLDIMPDGTSGQALFTVEAFETVAPEHTGEPDYVACRTALEKAFADFASRFPSLPQPFEAGRLPALYVLWSCIVPPCGHLTRRAVLMSNNWMPNVWTWDSVINAMGLTAGEPELAKAQFFLSLDLQTPEGLLPDYINPREVMWNFTKPPIHGIAVLHGLLDAFTPQELEMAYDGMQLQTDYWLRYMDSDHDGIPQYNHGNDCGWDNCTCFRVGLPIEGPDLCAYLILQMRALAQMAQRLGISKRDWQAEASSLLHRLLAHSFGDGRFHVFQSGTHREFKGGDSLYPYMPLVLGSALPQEIFQKLLNELKEPGRFLTDVGLASESLRSPYYEGDSYWRGPVWPSVMLLLVQGIADGGDKAFARELAQRFCSCILSNGFSENFHAVTGKGLRDPAHTWTAAAYLALAQQYL